MSAAPAAHATPTMTAGMDHRTTWTDWSCHVGVSVQRGSADAARRIVSDLMQEVDRSVSRFREDSELQRVNAHPGRLVPVGSLTFSLLETALEAAHRSDGLVDPTLGRELRAVGYDVDVAEILGRRSSGDAPLRSGPRRAGWRSVVMDRTLRRVGVPRGVELDLGATAKAWTVDEAARRVRARLRSGCLVEIGGDVKVEGPSAHRWRLDVAETRDVDPTRVDLRRGAVATSSTVVRRWRRADGSIGHHLLDPRSGSPVDGPWRTVSVWAPDAVRANTASTAAIVAGGGAVEWLRSTRLPARLVRTDGSVVHVGGWPHLLDGTADAALDRPVAA